MSYTSLLVQYSNRSECFSVWNWSWGSRH